MQNITVGRLYKLDLLITPLWIVCTLLYVALLAWIGANNLGFSPAEAIVGGLVGTAIFWLSELVHQLGHAWAARRIGYPMTGIRFWGLTSTCLYPSDEPTLPAKTHIFRALGGPPVSLITSVLAGVLALALRGAEGGLIGWLALFAFLINFFVLTLGAFLPLGFTDGSTLLRYWGKP
jgi:fumarate reductase subunit D